MRIAAYVDGLNLYYGSLKNTPHKWLDVVQLVDLTLTMPDRQIESLKYFTASVSGAVDPQAPRRQQIYLNALETLPEVSVIFGNFKSKPLWRPLMSLPIGNCEINIGSALLKIPQGDLQVRLDKTRTRVIPVRQWSLPSPQQSKRPTKERLLNDALHVQVHSMEEKGSDVNLAVHLVNDAWRDTYDVAVVVSNDRDLAEAIRLVTEDVKKKVILLCPARKGGVQKLLRDVASDVKYVRPALLRAAQLPTHITGSRISKPAGW